jgi:hypothetical protein
MLLAVGFCPGCAKDKPVGNNDPPPSVDSSVVLRVDSVSLYGSDTQYVERSFTFSKKIRKVEYQFWAEENCSNLMVPYTKLEFRSQVDSEIVSYEQFDSIPIFVMNNLLFSEGDSCQTVTIKMGITNPPFENKYIKIWDIKVIQLNFGLIKLSNMFCKVDIINFADIISKSFAVSI